MEIPTILIVEDDKDINKLIKNALTKKNFKVDNAYDGNQAILKYNKTNYDLIILDLMLPIVTGEEDIQFLTTKHLI